MLKNKIKNSNISIPLEVNALESILAYQNHDVVLKFRKEWDVSPEEADDIFMETKKFLYISSKCQTECFNITVHEQFMIIDEMWHTFIQFTDAYSHFCQEYLGGFLHHFPATNEMRQQEIRHVTKLGLSFNDYRADIYRKQVNKICSTLGINTVVKWYANYAVTYSIDNLNKLRKPIVGSINDQYINSVAPFLNLPAEKIYDIIMKKNSWGTFDVCGCNGKGCGAGCSCN